MIKKPLLAATVEDISALRFPIFASPKIDGIRCLKFAGGTLLSRKFIRIPNLHIQHLAKGLGDFMDGELVTLNSERKIDTFHDIQSKVMSIKGEPIAQWLVFDHHEHPNSPFVERRLRLQAYGDFIKPVINKRIDNLQQLEEYEAEMLLKGYEGVMLRDLYGRYKQGRSTFNEGILLKLKRFEDCEAEITGFEELYNNLNPSETDNVGAAKRSHSTKGKVPAKTLGALIVDNLQFGTFNIGSGFNENLRFEIWNNKEKYLGKTVTFKYQSHGTKDKPRCPIFKGIRYD